VEQHLEKSKQTAFEFPEKRASVKYWVFFPFAHKWQNWITRMNSRRDLDNVFSAKGILSFDVDPQSSFVRK